MEDNVDYLKNDQYTRTYDYTNRYKRKRRYVWGIPTYIGVPITPDDPHIPYEPGPVRYFCPKYRFCYFIIKNKLRTVRKSYKFYK